MKSLFQNKSFRSGWLEHRFEKLPTFTVDVAEAVYTNMISRADLESILKVNSRTVGLWLSNEHFKAAQIAVPVTSIGSTQKRWIFEKEKLRLWLIAIGALKPKEVSEEELAPAEEYAVAANPPRATLHVVTRLQLAAREALGLPADFYLKS